MLNTVMQQQAAICISAVPCKVVLNVFLFTTEVLRGPLMFLFAHFRLFSLLASHKSPHLDFPFLSHFLEKETNWWLRKLSNGNCEMFCQDSSCQFSGTVLFSPTYPPSSVSLLVASSHTPPIVFCSLQFPHIIFSVPPNTSFASPPSFTFPSVSLLLPHTDAKAWNYQQGWLQVAQQPPNGQKDLTIQSHEIFRAHCS